MKYYIKTQDHKILRITHFGIDGEIYGSINIPEFVAFIKYNKDQYADGWKFIGQDGFFSFTYSFNKCLNIWYENG